MKTNVFAVILAGGRGTRMGNVEKPKQFMEIGGKPLIAHTIEKFSVFPEFEQIIVLVPKQWKHHTSDIVKKYVVNKENVVIIEGGSSRNETIMNAINYIEAQGALNDETIIVTHDSVRPFVTHRILEENVKYARECGACDTVIPATDTIVRSEDNELITEIPDRSKMYQGQTPQSFHAKRLKEFYVSLSEEEKKILTDACKILVLKGDPIHLVEGEVFNIKITYPFDLLVAQALLGGDGVC